MNVCISKYIGVLYPISFVCGLGKKNIPSFVYYKTVSQSNLSVQIEMIVLFKAARIF